MLFQFAETAKPQDRSVNARNCNAKPAEEEKLSVRPDSLVTFLFLQKEE